ncbi:MULTISPECIES: cytosine permease [unclassified Rhodococcus (in: high G+C Gram-positive bacteria)]|uniref:cytosine permease n=1 Tax=unclassified Rhodococcus (in: high G+C Gram-positive bacteria) TaxID=192944 RepID=UPI00211B514A|nr:MULTISPECIES: cytosine permease [unclassified Rhodococcus (in: high G+C Gram-positive bacteria)]
MVLLGFTIFTPTMLAGAALGTAFTFCKLILVIAAGSAILGAYVAMMGFAGARTGLTTVLMARYSFGTRGSKLASLLLGGTQVGWYGVIIGTIGELTSQALGWEP